MWLQKLSHGFLQVLAENGLHQVTPTFVERLRLVWMFRNFSILPQQVLSVRQQRLLSTLCADHRMFRYWGAAENERGKLIGTIVSSALPPPPPDDRRGTPRYPVKFEVRYGLGRSLTAGEGCDLSTGGLAFIGTKPYPPGTELEVRYRLDPAAEWTTLRALVRYCVGERMGVEFLNVKRTDAASKAALHARAAGEST